MMRQKRRCERWHMRLIIRDLGKHVCDNDEVNVLRLESRRLECRLYRFTHEVPEAFIPPLTKSCEPGSDEENILLHTRLVECAFAAAGRPGCRGFGRGASARAPLGSVVFFFFWVFLSK